MFFCVGAGNNLRLAAVRLRAAEHQQTEIEYGGVPLHSVHPARLRALSRARFSARSRRGAQTVLTAARLKWACADMLDGDGLDGSWVEPARPRQPHQSTGALTCTGVSPRKTAENGQPQLRVIWFGNQFVWGLSRDASNSRATSCNLMLRR
jgi:hypothetical protein